MGRNRLSQSTRLAPRIRLSLRLILECVVPTSLAVVGLLLVQIHPGQLEKDQLENSTFVEIVQEEGMRGFMP